MYSSSLTSSIHHHEWNSNSQSDNKDWMEDIQIHITNNNI